jgi:cell division protein FtsZ
MKMESIKVVTIGAGGDGEIEGVEFIGLDAGIPARSDIQSAIFGAGLVFVLSAWSDSAGAGAVTEAAREAGALTLGVFLYFEGGNPRIGNLLEAVPWMEKADAAFALPDRDALPLVRGISGLILRPGFIGLDLADIRSILAGAGTAITGVGTAAGKNRATEAAKQALANLPPEPSIEGARRVLFNLAGSADVRIDEVEEVATVIGDAAHPDAERIIGMSVDGELGEEIRVTLIATGFDLDDHGETVDEFDALMARSEPFKL